MPEKRNDSKIMSMLERKGIVRKAGEDPSDDTPGDTLPRYDPNIKPLFTTPEDTMNVKPAARQPVPGMIDPVFPYDKSIGDSQEKPKTEDSPPPLRAEVNRITEPPAPRPPVETPAPRPIAEPPAPRPSVEPARQPSSSGPLSFFRNGGAAAQAPAPAPVTKSEAQPDNYTDRYLSINELYDALALRSKKTDSVYLIEEYLQTLPGSLPDSQRRDIVSKIISASGFDYDLLMGDGVLRVKMLKEYAERFARYTDDYIASRQAELDELDQQILRTRKLIENRKDLHKKQFFTIEAEAQRLKDILTFISG